MTDGPTDYERGEQAGRIEARLAGHDRHFAAINGHLATLAEQLTSITLAMQRLADSAIAREDTVIATAKTLADADKARRSASDQRWSPWAKLFAVVGVVGVVVAIYLSLRGLR